MSLEQVTLEEMDRDLLSRRPYKFYTVRIFTQLFQVNLPDGRVQTVRYHADHEGGFVADVTYEGTPQYPAAPKGGYGPYTGPGAYKGPQKAYKPAPPAPYHSSQTDDNDG